jgi:ATP/maltotriose-dependent transcriptional regulator MalT
VNTPEFAVRRPRLERILDEGVRRRLTMVVAPAGYGKSVLISQWASSRLSGTASWVTIDERDADPLRLGSRLVAALGAARPQLSERGSAALRGASTRLGDELIEVLFEELEAIEEDIVVVLDDFDRLEGPSVEDLGRLIVEAPPRVHFVVASRSDPTIPSHRLRTRGELVEPRAGDLRFTESEAQQVIERVSGQRLSREEVVHLLDLTEGWPVAVELAALSLRGAQDPSELMRFGGTDRTVVDYLSAEVLEKESPELRSFLLDISVLEEVNGDLADAATGRADGARLLQVLEQRGLFVGRLPGDGGWYRLHRLVREFLRQDLRTSDPSRPTLVLGRAAEWWLQHDDAAAAASCLTAARAWDDLIDLVYAYGLTAWDHGAARTVIAWIEAIPEPVRRRHVRLRLIHAALELVVGGGAKAAVTVGELERDVELTPGEQLAADLVMCSLAGVASPHRDMLTRAERALVAVRQVPTDDIPDVLIDTDIDSVTAYASATAALTSLLLGDGGAAQQAARAVDSPEGIPDVCRVLSLGAAALIEALAGHTERAAALARLAADRAAGSLSVDHPGSLFWRASLAVVARLRDDLDEADDLAQVALDLAVQWRRWPFVAFLVAEQGMIDLARGEPRAALARLRDRARFPIPPAGPMVEGRLTSIELRAGVALGDGDDLLSGLDPELIGASWELAAAAVSAAIASGQVDTARKHLEGWPPSAAPLGDIEHELCIALVELAEGAVPEARARAAALLHRTDRDRVVRPYVDAGASVIALLETVEREHPSRHLDEVLGAARQAHTPRVELVDPLSGRELEVLRYLPTRMGNAEIASALYVSTNTIKTHVKHIYQKLAAADRDDAVRIAREIGLL